MTTKTPTLSSLYLKALKQFPNSPAQLKTRKQIEELIKLTK